MPDLHKVDLRQITAIQLTDGTWYTLPEGCWPGVSAGISLLDGDAVDYDHYVPYITFEADEVEETLTVPLSAVMAFRRN